VILIVKLDGDLWLAVASGGGPDKFIDNAANSVLKILLVTAFFASLSEEDTSRKFGAAISYDARPCAF
jgi:hypothetical protein